MTAGMLVEVTVLDRGSSATADVASGLSVVPIEDPTQFDEDGGVLDICGNRYAYTAVDADALTITLATTLGTAVAEFDPVLVVAGGEVAKIYSAVIDLGAGDNISVEIPYAWRAQLREGLYDDPVPVIVSDDLTEIVEIPGRSPYLDGAALDPTTIPDQEPTEAPASSPTLTVKPTSQGFIVSATDIAATSLIDYFVSTSNAGPWDSSTLLATTRSQVQDFRTLPDGMTPFAPSTDYYFAAIAHNDVGPAPVNVAAAARLKLLDTGQVDEIAIDKITSGDLVAAVALLGSLQVGQITITPGKRAPVLGPCLRPGGINIPLANGGLISLPADGSSAQFIRVLLEATSLLVYDNFELRGALNRIAGTLNLNSSITAFSSGPTVTSSWDDPATKLAFGGHGTGSRNCLVDNSTSWAYLVSDASGFPNSGIWTASKTTGVETRQVDLSALTNAGETLRGLVKVGTDWYLLHTNNASGLGTVKKYNSSWVLQAGSFSVPLLSGESVAVMGTDGTDLFFAYKRWGTDQKVEVIRRTTAGASPTTVMVTPDVTNGPAYFLWIGSGDFAATHYVFGAYDGVKVYSQGVGTAGVRQNTKEWANDTGGGSLGLAYVSGSFYSLTSAVYKLSPVITSTARSVRASKYDNDGTTHETAWSPATSFTHLPRQWMKVVTAAPEDAGGADDPNAIRHYIQSGGSGNYWRQTDITATPWSAWYGTPAGSGSSAVSSPDFSGVSNPGVLATSKVINRTANVVTKQIASNVATLTLDRAPRYSVGNSITVSSVDATFNGTYTITAVDRSNKTVSYAKTASNTGPTSATGSVSSSAPAMYLSGDGSAEVGPYSWDAAGVPIVDDPTAVSGLSGTTVSTSSGTFIRHGTMGWDAVFVAPASGTVLVEIGFYLVNVGTLVMACPEVRTGGTAGSGTIVFTAGTSDAVGANTTGTVRYKTSVQVKGLTPGSTYNAYGAIYRTAAGEAVNNPFIRVTPQR